MSFKFLCVILLGGAVETGSGFEDNLSCLFSSTIQFTVSHTSSFPVFQCSTQVVHNYWRPNVLPLS